MRSFRALNHYYLSAVLISLLGLGFLYVQSANALEKGRYSESEKVGFAFHKLGRFDPDFEAWIRNSDRYDGATMRGKAALLQDDYYRLEAGYINFLPDVDLISLNMEAHVEASNFFQRSQMDDDTVTSIKINLLDLPENYFPFQVGEYWIAVVIKDFEKVTNMSFKKDEYRQFVEKFKLAQNAYQLKQKVTIDLKLRPVSVDTTEPIMLDGFEMWLMLAEIADMQLWRDVNGTREYLWHHTAPWYVSDEHRQLLRLKQ